MIMLAQMFFCELVFTLKKNLFIISVLKGAAVHFFEDQNLRFTLPNIVQHAELYLMQIPEFP